MQNASVLLSWGPPRMGTTWLYNVLRAMAAEEKTQIGVVADGVTPPPPHWNGPVIIKSHRADQPDLISRFDRSIDLYGLVMMRDPEPTLASLVRTQTADRSELLTWLEKDVASYEAVLPLMTKGVVIREEWVAGQAPAIIEAVAALTGMDLTTEQCAHIAAQFDREQVRMQVADLERQREWAGEFSNYDRETQWHAGHIGSGNPAQLDLTDAEAKRVSALREAIDDLTRNHGLWDVAVNHAPGRDTQITAMDFVSAREALIKTVSHQPSGVSGLASRAWGWVRRGT